MLLRVKQVLAAVTARIYPEDEYLLSQQLNEVELTLFRAMNLPDQRHALNVAYTAHKLSTDRTDVDTNLLMRCALLHDVGKVKGDVSTLDKILTVLAHKLCPAWSQRWGRQGRGSKVNNLRHAVYIYYNHAERSAAFLAAAGCEDELVSIVAKHHKAPADDDPPELKLLRQADDLN